MMRGRAARRGIASFLLGALLFAQAAISMAACEWLRVAPAQAFMTAADEPSCHQGPKRNANVCLAHCLSADQSFDTPQIAVLAWNPTPLRVISDGASALVREVKLDYTLPRAGAPPPRILFHSFLI